MPIRRQHWQLGKEALYQSMCAVIESGSDNFGPGQF